MACDLSSSVSSSSDPIQASSPVISDETMVIFLWVGYSIICELIDIFGTATNVFNIVCFIKLGFQDPINVSLFGLAISDLFCVASLLWTNICMNPAFNEADLPFEPMGVQFITSGILHTNFNRLTSCITAFITLERCLCITAPLKVKRILTSKRVAGIIICLYVVLLTSVTPVYLANSLEMVFFPPRNKTIIGLVYRSDHSNVEQISFAINNAFIPFAAFTVITTCTVVLVVKLRNQAKWRQMATASGQSQLISTRDQKLVKMVIVISALFIVCFIPVSAGFITYMVTPEFKFNGKHRNVNILFIGIGLMLESTNSATNIFIYYFMSSKYRNMCHKIFHIETTSSQGSCRQAYLKCAPDD